MAVKTRIDVLTRETIFSPAGGLSPQDVAAQFAAAVAQDIAAVDADNASAAGRALPRHTFVDGSETDDLRRVRPDGVIVATWDLGAEVVRYVWDQLLRAVPRRSGRFADSQRIYADGVEVESPEDTLGADEVVIASVAPYARKIEGQFKQPRHAWAKNDNGVYHATAALAASKYGNIARIKFGVRLPVGGATDLAKWASAHTAMIAHERKREKQIARDTRQPAIVISFK